MATKAEIIEIIRAENPNGLKTGSDETGYYELTAEEYEEKISEWAEARLQKLLKEKQLADNEAKKELILQRLNLTSEEVKLLLS